MNRGWKTLLKDRKYGVEIEMTGISREKAANTLCGLLGGEVRYLSGSYKTWVCVDAKGRKWKFVTDSSILTEGGGDNNTEMVTDILGWDDMEDLQEAVRQLRYAGARTNSSCGVHVHVNCGDMTAQHLKNLVNMFAMREEMIFRAVGTSDARINRWSKRTDMDFVIQLNQERNLTIGKTENLWYKGKIDHTRYHYSRYYALNFHSLWTGKGAEFRMFNGTLHAEKIKAYVALCCGMVERAVTIRSTTYKTAELADDAHSWKVWLYRIGMTGDYFANQRMWLTKNMDNGVTVPVNAA